jgi:hypothetical protein
MSGSGRKVLVATGAVADPARGIGAARDYIKQQFDQIAQTSGGRMTVALESYVQPPASRIPVPTTITDVVATLKGADPRVGDRPVERRRVEVFDRERVRLLLDRELGRPGGLRLRGGRQRDGQRQYGDPLEHVDALLLQKT